MRSRSVMAGFGVVSLSIIGVGLAAEGLGSTGWSGGDHLDEAIGSVSLTAPAASVTIATTTTMPPRAEAALLAPVAFGVLAGRVIVVDPGHNGRNFEFADIRRPGVDGAEGPLCNTTGSATASGVREVDINWRIGTRLTELLRNLGAAVVVTHADNEGFGPCADERGRLAQISDADVFISLHADGAAPSASGFHVIHPSPHPKLRPGTVAESSRLAATLRDELIVIGGRPANYVGDRGVQARGDLGNLNNADRPSVLAELGNLRNALDASLLSNPASDELLARALARGVVRYLGAAPVAALSADLDGDGLVNLLLGAPSWMLPTTNAIDGVAGAPAGVPDSDSTSTTVPGGAPGVPPTTETTTETTTTSSLPVSTTAASSGV